MNCVFRLDHYQIESVAVILNGSYDTKLSAHTGDVTTTIVIAPRKDDFTKYLLTLEIIVRPKKDHENEFFPYDVAVKGRAFFTFKEKYPKKQAEQFLRLNGVSILYGLLRAQVAQITAQSVHGQFLLPAMNFVELVAQQKATKCRPSDVPKEP